MTENTYEKKMNDDKMHWSKLRLSSKWKALRLCNTGQTTELFPEWEYWLFDSYMYSYAERNGGPGEEGSPRAPLRLIGLTKAGPVWG
jgi:hypothetical protein